MKINDKIISIPPFISTTWDNVASLHMEGNILVIGLMDGSRVDVPDLPEAIIQQMFDQHALIVEQEEDEPEIEISGMDPFSIFETLSNTFQLGLSGMEGLGMPLGHNPDQAGAPPIPAELLAKIAQLAKLIAPEGEVEDLPKPEPHCNCAYCQVARALRASMPGASEEEEEHPHKGDEVEVSDEDLLFRQWDIHQKSEHLYEVTNRLDPTESYQVHLADPVGCTCGVKNCEHLLAVLRS
ncbi:MAG: hypothetical protein KDK78_05250 [Chlamydiia bacterium]|nr:hypothetical protein [Chlamydiia bacterium]